MGLCLPISPPISRASYILLADVLSLKCHLILKCTEMALPTPQNLPSSMSLIQQPSRPLRNPVYALTPNRTDGNCDQWTPPAIPPTARVLLDVAQPLQILLQSLEVRLRAFDVSLGRHHEPRLRRDRRQHSQRRQRSCRLEQHVAVPVQR